MIGRPTTRAYPRNAPAQVLEGRTIRDLQDLRDFCDAALLAASIDSGDQRTRRDVIHLDVPVDMRLVRETLSDGSRVYNIAVSRW
jgi:hypothetical protein